MLAAVGVALIADVRWSGSPSGVLWALAAAALWAAYILLGKRVAGAGNGLDDMAVGFAVAAVVLSPLLLLPGGGTGLAALVDPVVLLLAVGVGVLSSVVPYVLDQIVLRRVGQARFAVLLALLPATAISPVRVGSTIPRASGRRDRSWRSLRNAACKPSGGRWDSERFVMDPSSPLATAEFLVVDTETNGLGGERCELTEIGAVLVGGGELHDRWETLVAARPTPLSRGIQRFTGITQAMVDPGAAR